MQFVIIAKDGEDDEALNRRTAARQNHITYGEFAAETGEHIMAAALLDKENNMRGSVMIVDFDNVDKLQEWLDKEPYVTGGVWAKIDVIPCKVAPVFADKLVKKPQKH